MSTGAGRIRSAHARAGPSPPRSVQLERREPVHRVERRGPDRAGRVRGHGGRSPAGRRGPGLDLRVLHTSVLTRAIRTAELTLSSRGPGLATGPPPLAAQRASLRRPAGPEQEGDGGRTPRGRPGQGRGAAATPPRRPRSSPGSEHDPAGDPRYRDVPADALPATECLADVVARVLPYWEDAIVPDLLAEGPRGGAVLVVAHGNSLRALRKHIDGIGDDEIVEPGDPDRHPVPLPAGRRPRRWCRRTTWATPRPAEAAAEAVRRQAG